MTLGEIYTIFTKVLDVAILWFIFYYILKYIRKNVKLTLIFKGVLIIVLLKLVSVWLDLNTVGVLLEYVIESVPIAIIVLFQPEIRNVLESIGRSQLLGRHKVLTVDEREKVVYEIMQAVEYMKRNRIGALMVIERDYSLSQYIENANKLYADISSELLISIFFPNNPLHDGAVIIANNKIIAAACILPLAGNRDISKELGTRHRAAVGISKESDAIAIVVSEESGKISIAKDGTLIADVKEDVLKKILIKNLITNRLEDIKEKKKNKTDSTDKTDKTDNVEEMDNEKYKTDDRI